MTVNRVSIFLLTIAIGCGTYTVKGFECGIAKEPIIITGDITHSVNFTWDCTLMLKESILSIMWLKDDVCIAKFMNSIFTPCESYRGRVELFERYGISVHNISRKDSGHYNMVIVAILINGSLHEYLPCHPTYLPVLPEQRSEFNEGTALQFAIGEQSSQCDQQRPSKLEIGLISGFLSPTVIIGLGGVFWYFRRRRHNANHSENEIMSPEQTQMLSAPISGVITEESISGVITEESISGVITEESISGVITEDFTH